MKDLATVMQEEWEESWATFVARHDALCSNRVHDPAALLGNLEQCPGMDDDPMANFAYGTLLTLRHMAAELQVPQPGSEQDVVVGRVAQRVH